jgi:hypothetical protein
VRRHHAFQIAIPTLRDPRLQLVAEHPHRTSQKASGYINLPRERVGVCARFCVRRCSASVTWDSSSL